MELSGKSPTIRTHGEDPLNLETPPHSLRESFITPVERFFVRSHGTMPKVDPGGYTLTISGLVESSLDLTLKELKKRFPKKEMTAALHCAGNRRAELMQVRQIPGETAWGVGAIGNARWTGISLRDVLLEAGVDGDAAHVAFTGLDEVPLEDSVTRFGGSIPLEKALAGDVLLAYEMNGETLPRAHGYPLRVVAAGYIGARSVKWLSEIEVRGEPSENYFHARDYRLYPADADPGEADPAEGEPLGDLYVNCAICRPAEGELVSGDPVKVAGYATTGGGRGIERVEVSADGGETWSAADLTPGEDSGSWVFWEARVEPGPERREVHLLARARDTSGGVQPASPRQAWNPKGYVNNAYHRVNIRRTAA
ncbi:molybdopterin-dependent oxidoreductase [Rubrobacter aplysinae]|uniref:molybdopterin-dependent oxidoreductase n=1 Tax=Rubrobacter aplysinae TaxID=909625 RepID=UPI00069F8D56|nr:molybdopterin-dependent oxidoreductase [Rubrobacter aplysinae]